MSTPIILQHGERRSSKGVEVNLEGGQCVVIKPGEALQLTLDAEGDVLLREVDLPTPVEGAATDPAAADDQADAVSDGEDSAGEEGAEDPAGAGAAQA